MNKQIIFIILCFVGLSLFFINPINAENFIVNGDFETGNFNNWTFLKSEPDVFFTVTSEAAYNSNYGCKITSTVEDDAIFQNIEWEYIDSISFDYKIVCVGTHPYFRVAHKYISFSDHLLLNDKISNDWEHKILNKNDDDTWNVINNPPDNTKAFNDYTKLLFGIYVSSASITVYLDNIIAEGTYPPCTINFNPNIDETENFPTLINFSLNQSCFSNGDTSLNTDKIYMYRDGQNINTWYLYNLQEQNNYNLTHMIDRGVNCTYEVKLWSNTCGFIASDTIDYIYNESNNPDFPDPDPTPDITPLPTYTPPPTPIPPDNPITPNNTLNTSWYQGYISIVDSCLNGLFSPIYNATAHFMYPTIVLTETGGSLMIESEIIFEVVTEKILIATSMMEIFFNCLPDKLIYVMIYYLLWLVILLVFKGAA